jgi:sugar/nucleoside kinase (ribokinase family)
MACAIGVLGREPRFVSTRYEGELSGAVELHLKDNNVRWCRTPISTPLPLFHARLRSGGVTDEHFIGDQAIRALTPTTLNAQQALFRRTNAIITCTDLSADSLLWLRQEAAERKVPFWLLSSDTSQASKLRVIRPLPDCIALNLSELAVWHGTQLSSVSEAIEALRSLLPHQGRALLTLGSSGALLVSEETEGADYQPAPVLKRDTAAVGAGDVMFGCLLAARLAGVGWVEALRQATAQTAAYLDTDVSSHRPYHALLTPTADVPGRRWLP